MQKLATLFLLAPVLRGFIALAISGAAFPVCGVMILRLDLVPLRYMLMHGVILGGAIALAANIPLVPAVITVNLLLVLLMFLFSRNSGFSFSGTSAATMVFSMALASLITHIFGVPAKDSLSLLWGSPFTISAADLTALAFLSAVLILYVVLNFRNILSLFFDTEISEANGIRIKRHYVIMVLMVALVVAFSMKFLGAFMVDSLLILPVLISVKFQKITGRGGIKKLFLQSGITGFLFASFGYILAIMLDFPPGATIAFLSGVVYIAASLWRKH